MISNRPQHPFAPFAEEDVEQSIPQRFEQQVRALMGVAADSPEADAGWRQLSALTAQELPILPLVFHVDVVGYNTDRVGGLNWHLSEFAQRIPDFEGLYIKK